MRGVYEDRVKLWIQALRSGEYTQTTNVLERFLFDGTKAHCCLGVAMKVALANGYSAQSEDDMEWGAEGMDEDIALYWYGFKDSSGGTDPELGSHVGADGEWFNASCVQANDDLGWSFRQIADAVEKHYITPNIEGEA